MTAKQKAIGVADETIHGLFSIWTDAVQLDSWDNLRYLAAVPWLQWFGMTLNNGISIDIHKARYLHQRCRM